MTIQTESETELARLRAEIFGGSRVISVGGLTSIASRAFVLSRLQSETRKTFVVVADSNKELETWTCDLNFWCDCDNPRLLSLPSFETDVYSGVSPHAETEEKRALALWNLATSAPDFLVASIKSLITKTAAPEEIRALGAVLKRDEDFAPEDLIERLAASGYVREEPIKNIGEFSVRGGIIDVWSPAAENPVRIEFFGDTVDSIREFDAETQLSTAQVKEIALAPMREFAATSQDFKDWAFFARERFAGERFARNLKDRTDFAEEGENFSGWEFLLPMVKPRAASVFDYLKDCVFIIDEPTIAENSLALFYENLEKRFNEITELGDVGLEPRELFLIGEELREKLGKQKRIELRTLGKAASETDESLAFANENPQIQIGKNKSESKPLFLFPTAEIEREFSLSSRSTRKFHGNLKDFADEVKRFPAKAQKAQSQSEEENRIFVLQSHGLSTLR